MTSCFSDSEYESLHTLRQTNAVGSVRYGVFEQWAQKAIFGKKTSAILV